MEARMSAWYVVNTHPHQEERAWVNLRRQGYGMCLPRLRKVRRHARREDMVLTPLFPGYLFVRLAPELQAWRAINATFGVRRLLCEGERPRALPAAFVEALEQRMDLDGAVAQPESEFMVGEPLRLLSGPFADHIGTMLHVADKDRIALLLSLLGREVKVVVSRRQVAAVA
jgi:transcriptional antiterminator RfaH